MSTQAVACPKGEWTQITTTSKDGAIVLRSGGVVLTEQATLPTLEPSELPWAASMVNNGDSKRYCNIEATDFIYAYGVDDSELDVTPVGGVL